MVFSAAFPPAPPGHLALALAVTIRHDGRGGVADDLETPAGLAAWLAEHVGEPVADPAVSAAVRELRAAVRALFARAVRPGPPSPADAHRLLPEPEALARLNEAAARVPVVPRLDWPAGGAPALRAEPGAAAPAADVLCAALARDAMALLAGPDRARLRACPAPRCVRYFVQDHPRQAWCKPSCGNRARVARHHQRHRTGDS